MSTVQCTARSSALSSIREAHLLQAVRVLEQVELERREVFAIDAEFAEFLLPGRYGHDAGALRSEPPRVLHNCLLRALQSA